jgi:hypothetical protein
VGQLVLRKDTMLILSYWFQLVIGHFRFIVGKNIQKTGKNNVFWGCHAIDP